jgi:tetratricopeptide (TPR) repeat protein
VLAIETWMQLGKLDAARAMIPRYEQERSPSADDYVALGLQLMGRALPPPAPILYGLAAQQPPTDTPDIRLALELLEKAAALRPDDPRILLSIATFLMIPRPDLARPFAERAAQSAPDEPEILIMLGVALGLADQVAAAKSTLQRAARLARQQGRADLHEHAQELRRVVGTPMLRMMLSAGLAGLDEDDLDDLFG